VHPDFPDKPKNPMKFEHYALNVPQPAEMARWYVEHLGFQIVRSSGDEREVHFLADETGRVVVEIYRNPAGPTHDFPAMHPLSFHAAVVSADARADSARLQAAGATLVVEEALPDGSLLIMLRDPWGVPLQLCQRARPF